MLPHMTAEKEVKGDILWKSPTHVEWKIPNFFSLPEDVTYYFLSHTFPYLDGIWCLKCYPNANSYEGVVIFLQRIHAASKHTVKFRIGIKIDDELEFISREYKECYASDEHELGIRLFVQRSYLESNRHLVAPSGEVTFFCSLGTGSCEKDAVQASQSTGKDVATETTEEDFRYTVEKSESREISNSLEGTDKLAQSFKNIFLSGDHYDTIIKVEDQEFRAHRVVLAVRSPVFDSLFRHDTIENQISEITVGDCNPDAFREFLSFLYTGKLENVSLENVANLYYIADKYQEDEAKSKCGMFMMRNLSVNNFCDLISLALKHSDKKLLGSAIEYFVKNSKKIVATVKWLSFLKEYPIESNELYMKTLACLIPE